MESIHRLIMSHKKEPATKAHTPCFVSSLLLLWLEVYEEFCELKFWRITERLPDVISLESTYQDRGVSRTVELRRWMAPNSHFSKAGAPLSSARNFSTLQPFKYPRRGSLMLGRNWGIIGKTWLRGIFLNKRDPTEFSVALCPASQELDAFFFQIQTPAQAHLTKLSLTLFGEYRHTHPSSAMWAMGISPNSQNKEALEPALFGIISIMQILLLLSCPQSMRIPSAQSSWDKGEATSRLTLWLDVHTEEKQFNPWPTMNLERRKILPISFPSSSLLLAKHRALIDCMGKHYSSVISLPTSLLWLYLI